MDNNGLLKAFDAVMLDMDGLVLDTEAMHMQAWRQACVKLGFELSEAWCIERLGVSFDRAKGDLQRLFGNDFPFERFHALAAEIWHQSARQTGVATKGGFNELVEVLTSRGIPFALATNSGREITEKCLTWAGIAEHFEIVITRDAVARPKPAPDIYLEAARRLGIEPHRGLAVEDSAPGIESACRAGAIPILVTSDGAIDAALEYPAALVFRSLGELAVAIEQWFQGDNYELSARNLRA